jgi:hypothetical protein
MFAASITQDERTVAVENESYRWAYLFVTFGLLAAAAYRGFVLRENSWDLFALVIASGVVTTLFQARRKALSSRFARLALVALLAAAVAAIGFATMGSAARAAAAGYEAAKQVPR